VDPDADSSPAWASMVSIRVVVRRTDGDDDVGARRNELQDVLGNAGAWVDVAVVSTIMRLPSCQRCSGCDGQCQFVGGRYISPSDADGGAVAVAAPRPALPTARVVVETEGDVDVGRWRGCRQNLR